jgi:hypothetical protein
MHELTRFIEVWVPVMAEEEDVSLVNACFAEFAKGVSSGCGISWRTSHYIRTSAAS